MGFCEFNEINYLIIIIIIIFIDYSVILHREVKSENGSNYIWEILIKMCKCAARRLAKKHIIALLRYWTNEKCAQKYGRDIQLSANKEIFHAK